MAPPDTPRLYEIAYNEAVRALSEQEREIDSLYGRAGLLVSAAAVTTSFLGAQALGKGGTAPAWLAMVAFVGVTFMSLAILWPRPWEFTVDPREVIVDYVEAEDPAPVEKLHRNLALYMQGSYARNRRGLDRLAALFQIAASLLAIEVGLWMIAIASPV